jgi:hypothetical protein
MAVFSSYLQRVEQKLTSGDATEHTHRAALETLLETVGDSISAINEPKRIACGAPDFSLQREGLTIGHVEAKDVGTSLDDAEDTDQLRRYNEALPSLVLTDYLEFRWFVDGEHIFELHPSEGGTRFVQREIFSGLLVPLLWGTLEDPTRRGFDAMNRALKERAEASARTAPR